MEVKLTKNAKEFLVFSYFGITEDELEKDDEDTKEKIVKKCAERAYLDMCRTLTFSEKMDGKPKKEKDRIEEERKNFRNEIISEQIVPGVIKLFSGDVSKFKDEHNTICENIKNEKWENLLKKRNKDDKGVFYYGQAQKWLNMTIKYMRMFGCFSKLINDNDFENELHVPVDTYIITKAKEEFGITRPRDPWSKWDDKEYKKFQGNLRDSIKKSSKEESPIEWEERVWIERAKELRENN